MDAGAGAGRELHARAGETRFINGLCFKEAQAKLSSFAR